MGRGQYITAILVFALGIWAGMGFEAHSFSGSSEQLSFEQPASVEKTLDGGKLTLAQLVEQFDALESGQQVPENKDKPSPYNWISMDNIKVFDNQVVITLPHPEWAQYLDTNSMDPVIDSDANTIQIVPKKESDIHVGDIVAYESLYHEGIITHRVIGISSDADGWFATMKGDNNPQADPGKIRFSQMKRVVVAIIY